ncbi:MAG: hypothetical protein WAX07_04680 [Candidatus Altiarchaeia archaeon]
MKENTKYTAYFAAVLLIIILFAGCASQEKETATTTLTGKTDDQGTSTTESKVTTTVASVATSSEETTSPDTTLPLNKGLNESCALDSDCVSGCCAYIDGKHKCSDAESCKPKEVTEEECYAKQMNWCAGKCQRSACGNCTKYLRCVVSTDEQKKRQVLVERAKDSPDMGGSCVFSGEYENAAGEEGYCGQNKGEMIYAKCGSAPEAKDCAAAYSNPSGYTYRIMNQRAFHASSGGEYDLWCFLCERAG